MNTQIFISYGHDDYTDKVRIIMTSLNVRKGYKIWWDEKLNESGDWVKEIEENLDKLIVAKPDSCFIYIMTPYSTSDKRYNYCINEILKALNGRIRILPVRLSTSAPMPLPIGSIQWFDLTQCEIDVNNKDFQQRFDRLCTLIDSREPIKIDGSQGALHLLLNPCQFTLDIDKHLQKYCPREWLLNTTIDWLENRDERVLLLEGGPGTGKTAYSLWIATSKLPEVIHAWHLCQYNDENTRSLMTCMKSLTWYLASRLPKFYDSVIKDNSKLEEIVHRGDENASAMLKEIILSNLKETHVNGEKVVILIDALDEASENGANKVADILSQYVSDMPEWLRFIITTRNDISVTIPLNDISYVVDLDSESNNENCAYDVREYVKNNLNTIAQENHAGIVDNIVERSGNVILYAKLMCDTINKGADIDVMQLPLGLNNYFDAHMRRYFEKEDYKFDIHALPIIHLMLSSFQPIKRKYIYKKIKQTENWCKDMTRFNRIIERFGPLLKDDSEYLLPFHKSLSDWLMSSDNKRFFVSKEDGYEKMSDWGNEVLSDDFCDEELSYHFYLYQPQYLSAANKLREFVALFSNVEFWRRRKNALGVDLLLQRMFIELSLVSDKIKDKLFNNSNFIEVLHLFLDDLFNKGLFVQLKNHGFRVSLHEKMEDKEKKLTLCYYYINGDYTTISKNIDCFKISKEPQIQNMLGLATKKCGLVTKSAEFFSQALSLAAEQGTPLEKVIYYYLNLSRVWVVLCRFDDGRSELAAALDGFYNNDWRSGVKTENLEFSSRQLELAVRYVNLETELYSAVYNPIVCEEEIAWADNLYSNKLHIDRYYPRHLHSKVLFLLREHRFNEIPPIFEVIKKCQIKGYDEIFFNFYYSLYQYVIGNKTVGLQIARAQLEQLQQIDTLLIERVQLLALVNTLDNNSQPIEINEELRNWYDHTMFLIKQIINNSH